MRPRDIISGRSAIAWMCENARRTRWVGRFLATSSWPAQLGALDLADWMGSPFGSRLAEVTNGTADAASSSSLAPRRASPADAARGARKTRAAMPDRETPPSRKPSITAMPRDGQARRAKPHAAPSAAPRTRLAAWAGIAAKPVRTTRPDIRAELGLEHAERGHTTPKLTESRFASVALGMNAAARMERRVSRMAGQSLFAPREVPASSGWESAVGQPETDFTVPLPRRIETPPRADTSAPQGAIRRSAPALASSANTDDARGPFAPGAFPPPAARRTPSIGWGRPIAIPSPGFIVTPPLAVLAKTTKPLAPEPTRPKAPGRAPMPPSPGTEPAQAEVEMIAPPDEVDPASFASLAYPREAETVSLTGPAARWAEAERAVRTRIDRIDFAEQLRVALIDDARRHGIEV